MQTGGDLGRRIIERRNVLGLSRAETARRAGMDERYLMALEQAPSATPSRAALWRLAAALDTTVEGLTGAGMLSPQGQGAPGARAVLDELDEEACRKLVQGGGVGRVVFLDGEVPIALPVNFVVVADNVVFRTSASSMLARQRPEPVSFEVDHIDDALKEGWSVLLTGSLGLVEDAQARARADAAGLAPWASGERDAYLELIPSQVTGRRIRVQ